MNDHKLIEWLKDDVEKLDKKVDSGFENLEEKMDALLKFKWQIMGGSVVASTFFGLLIQIAIAKYGK